MRLGFGIFLGYFLIAMIAAFFVLNVFVDEIKPSARQAMEDSLVDAANLLAELAVDEMRSGQLHTTSFAKSITRYKERQFSASIWGLTRLRPGFRIYITDTQGIVQFDSAQEAVGQDYSRWNDVYLTLKGQYGVRSSPDLQSGSKDANATTMYVAAPIKDGSQILGVLTVAKSNQAVEPFIERTRNKIINAGYVLLATSLIIGLLISLWLSASIQKLVAYAEAVTRGERTVLPKVSLTEVKRLGLAIESMRERLEGKRYVEEYIGTLTHEMKSPITAIRAATELLQEPMPEAQRQTFLGSIADQTRRLHLLIEKMLKQAHLENRQTLDEPERLDLRAILDQAVISLRPKLEKNKLEAHIAAPDEAMLLGDPFLLEQTLLNIAENAIDFSPSGATLDFRLEHQDRLWCLSLRDHGPGIPEYAKDRIFDRYYSLPRPGGGARSTGLGLAFVQQVMVLHGGRAEMSNHPEGGAELRLYLPAL